MSYYFLVVILINLLFITHFNKILTIIKVIDSPNQSHKTHKENIPAIGGILLFINILILVTYSFLNKEIFFSNTSVFNNTNELVYFFTVYSFFFFKGVFDADSFYFSPVRIRQYSTKQWKKITKCNKSMIKFN